MKRVLFTCLLLATATFSIAQTSDSGFLKTDRPTRTFSAYLVPKGTWQIETGYAFTESYQWISLPGGGGYAGDFQFFQWTTQVRYGLSNKVELWFSQDLAKSRLMGGSDVLGESDIEAIPTQLGLRVPLMNGKGLKPQIALMSSVAGGPFTSAEVGTLFDIRLNLHHQLTNRFSLGWNLIWQYDTDGEGGSEAFSAVLGYQFTKRFSAFVEVWGPTPIFDGISPKAMNVGFLYAITPGLQVDVSYGGNLTNTGLNQLFATGVSFRIPGN